jgi:chromosome segregation ATPase
MPSSAPPAAAIAARHRQTQRKLADVQAAIAQLRRETERLTVAAIARRAGVSSTFLYENPQARAMVQDSVAATHTRRAHRSTAEHDRIEATWRERALNAEEGLTLAHNEIRTQRERIGELMGQLRDKERATGNGESVQAVTTENTTLKRRVRQLTTDHRALQERLEGARTNLRYAENRIAELEAELVERAASGRA